MAGVAQDLGQGIEGVSIIVRDDDPQGVTELTLLRATAIGYRSGNGHALILDLLWECFGEAVVVRPAQAVC